MMPNESFPGSQRVLKIQNSENPIFSRLFVFPFFSVGVVRLYLDPPAIHQCFFQSEILVCSISLDPCLELVGFNHQMLWCWRHFYSLTHWRDTIRALIVYVHIVFSSKVIVANVFFITSWDGFKFLGLFSFPSIMYLCCGSVLLFLLVNIVLYGHMVFYVLHGAISI